MFSVVFILIIFILFIILTNVHRQTENFANYVEYFMPKDDYTDASKAMVSVDPILILFYDRADGEKNKKIKTKNSDYVKMFEKTAKDKAMDKIAFYIIDTSDNLNKSVMGTRMPLIMVDGPIIRYYKNPSLGDGKDGMETIEKKDDKDLTDKDIKNFLSKK